MNIGDTNCDCGADLAVDAEGRAYVSGWSDGSVTVGTNHLSGGQWIAKFGPDGRGEWLLEPVTTPFQGYDQGYGLAVDIFGNLFLCRRTLLGHHPALERNNGVSP